MGNNTSRANTSRLISGVTAFVFFATSLTAFVFMAPKVSAEAVPLGPDQFAPPQIANSVLSSNVQGFVESSHISDVNNDGNEDIVTLDIDSSSPLRRYVTSRLRNAEGLIYSTQTTQSPWAITFEVFDITNDGIDDAIINRGSSANSNYNALEVRQGLGDGTFSANPSQYIELAGSSTYITQYYVSDINGDGKKDLVANGVYGNGQHVFSFVNNGSGQFVLLSPMLLALDQYYYIAGVADFNRDSKTDLLISTPASQGKIFFSTGDGQYSTVASYADISGIGSFWAKPAIADFTGDGEVDIVTQVQSTNTNAFQTALRVYRNLGGGNFNLDTATIYNQRIANNGSLIAGDINSDGKGDLIGWNTGLVSVYIGDNTGKLVGVQNLNVANGYQPVLGDLNKDGNIDMVLGSGAANGPAPALSLNLNPPLDTVPPQVTGNVDRPANADGWYDNDVTVTWASLDPLPSSGTPTQPALTIASQEGEQTYTSTPSCDPAGNCATGSVTLKIDKTAPEAGAPAWSVNPKSTTEVSTLTVPVAESVSGLAQAEYFIGDTDPGLGNGATMTMSGANITTTFGTDFPSGVYKINVRAKDNASNWSAVVSDYLVVFNPNGPRMTGKKTIIPSLSTGDILPGLNSATQTDEAVFGFSVRYDATGQISANSDLQFSYRTGTQCNNPSKAQNCRSLELDADSVTWLTFQGLNDSEGVFQGTATMLLDGVISSVVFQVSGRDGSRVGTLTQDHFMLEIFSQGANPNTAEPIYLVSGNILQGAIRII